MRLCLSPFGEVAKVLCVESKAMFKTQGCQRLASCSQISILLGSQLDMTPQPFHRWGCMTHFCSWDSGWKCCPPLSGGTSHNSLSLYPLATAEDQAEGLRSQDMAKPLHGRKLEWLPAAELLDDPHYVAIQARSEHLL